MPPETVNSATSSRMKGMYSASSACTRPASAVCAPNTPANGSKKASDQAAAILPKWWCQKCGPTSGQTAIDSRMPTKGRPHSADSWRPSSSAAWRRGQRQQDGQQHHAAPAPCADAAVEKRGRKRGSWSFSD
jgi:hypothetical protein